MGVNLIAVLFSQAAVSAIMRSIGAQLISSIAVLASYYAIGSPIGLSLMHTTSLKGRGFFVGLFIGTTCLISAQAVHLVRLDWTKKAQEAFDLSKDDSKSEPVINEDILSMQNPNFLKYGVDPEEHELGERSKTSEDSKSSDPEKTPTEMATSFKKVLLYRLILLVVIVALFIVLSSLRAIKVVDHRAANATTTTSKPKL